MKLYRILFDDQDIGSDRTLVRDEKTGKDVPLNYDHLFVLGENIADVAARFPVAIQIELFKGYTE